jgi:hypothetical protein
MPRLKKPEDETQAEATIRKIKESIANAATRNEKVSFDRKMNNMVSFLAELQPIEDEITALIAQKMPIMDNIQNLRMEMLKDCVHPITHLVVKDNYAVCKFCERKFSIAG